MNFEVRGGKVYKETPAKVSAATGKELKVGRRLLRAGQEVRGAGSERLSILCSNWERIERVAPALAGAGVEELQQLGKN